MLTTGHCFRITVLNCSGTRTELSWYTELQWYTPEKSSVFGYLSMCFRLSRTKIWRWIQKKHPRDLKCSPLGLVSELLLWTAVLQHWTLLVPPSIPVVPVPKPILPLIFWHHWHHWNWMCLHWKKGHTNGFQLPPISFPMVPLTGHSGWCNPPKKTHYKISPLWADFP